LVAGCDAAIQVGGNYRYVPARATPATNRVLGGMEHGMRETMDQLDELVASLR